MNKRLIIIIVTIALGLSGCMLGPNFQKPEYKGSEQFRFATTQGDSLLNLKWWDLFDDPILDTLIKIALNENKDVLMAASRIESAKANIGFTKAAQYPSLRFGAGISASGFDGNNSSDFYAVPELGWEVGFWGKYRRMNEAAQANLLASEYGKRTIQLSLISSVASTYFSILSSYDQLKISTNTLASRDSGLYLMKGKYEGGLIALIDLSMLGE
jgi:multidrug efflux system outer membrane protein